MHGSTRRELGLRTRMLVAGVLCVVVASAAVVAGVTLVGVPLYWVLTHSVDSLGPLLTEPLALTLAAGLVIVLVGYVECAARAIQNAPSLEEVDPAATTIASVAIYGLAFSAIAIGWVALSALSSHVHPAIIALVVLFACFYLFTASLIWFAGVSADEYDPETHEDSETDWTFILPITAVYLLVYLPVPMWVIVLGIAGLTIAYVHVPDFKTAVGDRLVPGWTDASTAGSAEAGGNEDHRGVRDEIQRTLDRIESVTGIDPRAGVVLGVTVSLGIVYLTASVWPTEWVAVGVTSVAALWLIGAHFGDVVWTELTGDPAVLRDLDVRAGTTDESGVAEPAHESLLATVDRLARQADVPPPDVRVVDRQAPTAVTAGYRPSSSTIVVSRGLCEALDERQLEGVLAHEIAHVANRDAAVMTALAAPGAVARVATERYGMNPFVVLVAGTIYAVSRWYVSLVARGREYAADDGAVTITGDPSGLAGALETLDRRLDRRPSTDLRELDAAAAFSIVPPPWEGKPFLDRPRRFVARRLLGTHPATERRIQRLRTDVCEGT